MKQIQVLDKATIDKIAAGEVVERPASVVKELAENAVDAGADRITVEIRDGGIRLIRVTDNGGGIPEDQVPTAFLRHATSKIVSAADLSSLDSLGFRGEALSSISAVSRMEMITRTPDSLSAFRYTIEGGHPAAAEEIGAPEGTTVIVRDLFYNTPARAKFLKSAMTEAAHVSACVEQLVLSNPGIAFQFLVNGHTRLTSPGSGSLKDAVYSIYGRDLTSQLIPLNAEDGGMSVSGFIGLPTVNRSSRNYENYYVNGRYVKSRIISRAVEEGYGTKLMQHQFPFTCFFLQIDGKEVDVNVHPTKMEVRFSDERRVFRLLSEAVKDAFAGRNMTVPAHLAEAKLHEAADTERKPEPFETRALAQAKEPAQNAQMQELPVSGEEPEYVPAAQEPFPGERILAAGVLRDRTDPYSPSALRADAQSEEGAGAGPVPGPEDKQPAAPGAEEVSLPDTYEQLTLGDSVLSERAKPMRRIVGQVFSTYWILEYEDRMFLIDQHAAHEKVLFERLMSAYANSEVTSQMVSPPLILSLSMGEENLIREYRDAFAALGFTVEPFGGREYALSEVPYYLGGLNSAQLFRELLDNLEVSRNVQDLKIYVKKVATEACKAAVKGGGRLSPKEAEALIDELMTLEDPYHCPHGRPTILEFTRKDLEKKFKRIV